MPPRPIRDRMTTRRSSSPATAGRARRRPRRRRGARRRGADARPEAEPRRHARRPARRQRVQLRPVLFAADPARASRATACAVLVDGISSLDLSSSDPDHAVAINPLTAERIEVLHGPARCSIRRRRSAASSTSSTPAFRAQCPTEIDGRRCCSTTAPRPTSAPAMSASTCRSAATSSPMPTAPIRSMTTFTSAAICCPSRFARAGAGEPRSGDPGACRPEGHLAEHAPDGSTMPPAALAYVDGDLNIGISVQPS